MTRLAIFFASAAALLAGCTLSEPPPQPAGPGGAPNGNAPGGAPGGGGGAPGGAGGAPGGGGGAAAGGGAPVGGQAPAPGGPGGGQAEAGGTPPGSGTPGAMAGAGGNEEPKLKPRGPKACSWTPETEAKITSLVGIDAAAPVELTGAFTFNGLEGPKNRPILMEVAVLDDDGNIANVLSAVCDRGSDVALSMPGKLGKVQFAAFLDQTGNGPDSSDPAGRTQEAVAVEATAITGFTLEISTTPDLGDLAGVLKKGG